MALGCRDQELLALGPGHGYGPVAFKMCASASEGASTLQLGLTSYEDFVTDYGVVFCPHRSLRGWYFVKSDYRKQFFFKQACLSSFCLC